MSPHTHSVHTAWLYLLWFALLLLFLGCSSRVSLHNYRKVQIHDFMLHPFKFGLLNVMKKLHECIKIRLHEIYSLSLWIKNDDCTFLKSSKMKGGRTNYGKRKWLSRKIQTQEEEDQITELEGCVHQRTAAQTGEATRRDSCNLQCMCELVVCILTRAL